MFWAIKILAFLVPAVSAIVSVAVGRGQVSKLRKETGDRSVLTSVLSGDAFRKARHP